MWERLKAVASSFRREIRVYQLVRWHPRTPKSAKILIGAAVAYALSPIDLVPDFILVVGHLDDVIVVPLLVIAALKVIPAEVIEECRTRVGTDART